MEGSAYPTIGVVLLVVGCLLSILATARRTARPTRSGAVAPAEITARTTSSAVARLRRDVSDWSKRR